MHGKSLLSLAVLLLVCMAAPADAHKPSDSYLKITGSGPGDKTTLAAQWDISIKDLDFLLNLDADENGEITWGELKAQQSAITARALSRLSITADGEPVQLRPAQMMVSEHSDGTYAVLMLTTTTPGDVAELEITYNLLFDADPTHRGLVFYENGDRTSSHILSPSSPTLNLRTADASLWGSFIDYVKEGVWHIWIGFDHILFLLSLLLPAVLVFRDKQWHPVEKFSPACWTVLKIVSVFTLAHSITLWLAVMEYVSLPSQWIEATIAFSIIVTALNNLYPVLKLRGWVIAFVFGLIHGFGFANVLVDLGLSSATLAIALLGFNVGVELGQMAIVIAFLPLAYLLRNTPFYQWGILRAGSVVIAVIALLWMIERVGNVEILGF